MLRVYDMNLVAVSRLRKTVAKVFKNGRESLWDASLNEPFLRHKMFLCPVGGHRAAFVIFLYEGLITCKLYCTPYLSGWCRRAFFKKSFERNWGPQNRRNPISMLAKQNKKKRNEKYTNQRNKNNFWKKVLVVGSLKPLLVLGYLGNTLQ